MKRFGSSLLGILLPQNDNPHTLPSSCSGIAGILFLTLLSVSSISTAAEPAISFDGVENSLRDNLRAGLSLTTEACDAPAWKIKRLFRRADKELASSARALGYYQISIDKSLSFKNDCWQAHFNITPGETIRLDRVEIRFTGEAQHDASFTELIEKHPLQSGKAVHHGEYEDLKSEIQRLAAERGYFDGRFSEKKLQVDIRAGKASVLLHYDSGRRYRIDELILAQQAYNPELLDRYLMIRAGELYESNALAAMHRALSDSGYFESVDVRPNFNDASDAKISINVQLEPRKPVAYSLGLGAATDTGPRLSASYERRRLNRSGHRLQSKAVLSQVDSSIGLEYLIPMNRPHIDQLSFRTGYRRLDTDSSTDNTYTLGTRLIGKRGSWNETRYLDWSTEDSLIGNSSTTATLLVPGINWARTRSNDRIYPTKGSRYSLEVRGAHQSLFSDASFVQLVAAGKWIFPMSKARLLLRANSGLSIVSDFDDLPASYRFFAGGDQSVRGYDFQSLGPLDNSGEVTGGRYLLASSAEIEYPLFGQWSAALFVDAGNAFDDFDEGIKHSFGAGIRWQSPVGPIRLDLAIPSNKDEDSFRIHFSMGPDL